MCLMNRLEKPPLGEFFAVEIQAREGLDGTLTADCKFYALVRFSSIDISRRWLPDLRALRFLNGIEANDSAQR
jgi:hypothetical protein